MHISLSSSLRGALGVSLLAVSAAAQSLLSQGEIVMAEGDPIPGLAGAFNGGASSLDSAIMDLDGNLLFRARFTGGGSVLNVTDRAYFYGRSRDTLQMIMRGGDPEPSGTLGAGVTLVSQLTTSQAIGIGSSPRISPRNGWMMFGGNLIGPGIVNTGTTLAGRNDAALFHGRPGAWQVLAQRGGATGVGGTLFDTAFSGISYQTSSLNEFGTACFQATLVGGDVSGTSNNFAIFTGTPGATQVVQRKGDLITIGGNQVRIDFIGFNCALNRAGMVLHDERLGTAVGTPPPTTANDGLLMVWFPGGVNIVAMREGDPAPVPTGAANYGSPSLAQGFGATGKFAFGCTLTGGTVTTADDSANFIGDISGFQMVHREGDPVASLPGVFLGTANFTSSYSDYQGGTIAYYTTLSGASVTTLNDQCIAIGQPGNIQILAREGDAAPGFDNLPGFVSATFGDSTGTSGIVAGSCSINERGLVTFSQTKVTVVDAAGTRVLNGCHFAWEPTKGLRLLHSGEDVYQTVGGPVVAATAGGIQFPSSDGTPLSFNNNNDATLRVNFATGGAIVRTHVGSNQCKPSTISGLAGGVHTMELDAGATNANQVYLVLCGGLGTRPGFSFGGSQIDLNIDPVWTDLAFNSLNTAPWAGTFGLLDGTGKASASFSVPPSIFIFAPQDLKHVVAVVDLNTLSVPFAGEPCSMLLY